MAIPYTWNNMPPIIAVTCPKCQGEAAFTFGSNEENPKMGTLVCHAQTEKHGRCDVDQTHQLLWPQQAFYVISYRTNKLWGFDKSCTTDLRDFIKSTERKVENHEWQTFLASVPKPFLMSQARNAVVAKLEKLLGESDTKPV